MRPQLIVPYIVRRYITAAYGKALKLLPTSNNRHPKFKLTFNDFPVSQPNVDLLCGY